MVKIAAERGAKVTNKDYTGACWVGRHTYAADKCGLKPFIRSGMMQSHPR
jgi:hypothetical protein